MLSPIRWWLAGVTFLALVHSLSRPKNFYLVAFSSSLGCAAGYGLSFLNNIGRDTLEVVNEPLCLTAPPADFKKIFVRIYEHIDEHYNDLGQLNIGEEYLTVHPNVFAQIGVVDIDGIRKLWNSVVIPELRMCGKGSFLSTGINGLARSIEENTVFCDIGSGVGNVCLQVLGETRCKKVVGVEVIPSRNEKAKIAFSKAMRYYPEFFSGKEAVFIQDDLVNCISKLTEQRVTVVFSHSWMFDDDLMQKLTQVLVSVPTLLCVVTSRKLDSELLVNTPLKLISQVHLSADWNEHAPFYVYRKLM